MSELTLTRDGRIVQNIYEDEHWKKVDVPIDCELLHLTNSIELEENYTLRDYFKLIEKYRGFQLLDVAFPTFISEYKDCPKENCLTTDIDYLVINYVASYESKKDFKPSNSLKSLFDQEIIHIDSNIEYFLDLYGHGTDGETRWGIDLLNLNELLDHKIVLGPGKISIELPGNYEDYEKMTDKYVVRESWSCSYILFDFILTIIQEISFFGDKENKNKTFNDLEEKVDKIKKEIGE